ncbi:MAG: FoF1 ATP synthase subunit delta/epsilon [Bacteroidales bacterium]
MKINIITPDTTIYEGEVKDVKLIGLDGHFELLEKHAPIIAALTRGDIKIVDMNDQELSFSIDGGLLEKSGRDIQILAQ